MIGSQVTERLKRIQKPNYLKEVVHCNSDLKPSMVRCFHLQ